MNIKQVSWKRWTVKRFGLPLGAYLLVGLITGAQAQNAAFDPFAPDAVAPQEPTANPTAPKPVAPAQPVRPSTQRLAPAPSAAPAAPSPSQVTPLSAPDQPAPQRRIETQGQTQVPSQNQSLSDIEKLQRLQQALGQTSNSAAPTPFEQNSLAPTQPVAAPKVATPAATAPTPTTAPAPASDPKPALSRPLPQPILEEELKPEGETTDTAPAPSEGNLLDSIGGFFENLFSKKTESEPEATQADAAATSTQDQEKKEEQPNITQNAVEPQADTPAPRVVDPRLSAATFALGTDIRLGQSTSELSPKAKCFTKNRGMVTYCLNPTRWASPLVRHFDVSTHLYKGQQAIIQFDGEIATRLYALFNTDGFSDIIAFFEAQFGPATHQFSRTTRTLKKDVDNPTYVWRKENEVEGLTEVFEIRKIADTRGNLPDLQRGSVRVYFEGARSIFSLSSDLDFMELH